jgi:hypothetical protein
VQIDKQQIIDLLRQQGDTQKADEANQQLPDKVDPEQHSNLLERLGLNPQDLIKRFLGGKIPGL